MLSSECKGASAALLFSDPEAGVQRILVIQRDNIPGIPFAGQWEVPGGTIETGESPIDCALRELEEELHVKLPPDKEQAWDACYPMRSGGYTAFFVYLCDESIFPARLGDEGQGYGLMTVDHFLDHPDAVPDHQSRLRDFLNAMTGKLLEAFLDDPSD